MNARVKPDLFFPVEMIEDAEMGGKYASDRKVIVRTDTNQVLGIHGAGYQLVTNEEVFGAVDTAIRKSDLKMTGAKTTDYVNLNGASAMRTIMFKSLQKPIAVGDQVGFQLNVRNSYDGSWAFGFNAGAMRLACLNGMIVMDKDNVIKRKHTMNLDVNAMVTNIHLLVEQFTAQCKEWKRYTKIKITEKDVIKVLDSFPGMNDRLKEAMISHWQDNEAEIGGNLWALTNALTYWSTHADMRETATSNANVVQFNREDRVRRTIASPVFQKLALAA